MTYFMDMLGKIRWWLLALLIAISPFHAFLVTWLKIPGFSVWREVFVGLIIVLIAAEFFIKKSRAMPLDRLDWLILGLCALSLAWLPFQRENFTQWLLGLRFDVLPFIFLFFLRRAEWKHAEKLLAIFFASAGVVLVFGILQAAVLPQNFLTYFGYSDYQGVFTNDLGVPACQYLEHTDFLCRAISTFGGPTRYGTYLLLVLGMMMGAWKEWKMGSGSWKIAMEGRKWKLVLAVFLLATLVNIALTFSRSVWIGLFAMIVFGVFWFVPKRFLVKGIIGAVVIGAIALAGNSWLASWKGERSWPPPILKTIFVRESSTDEHARLFKEGAALLKEHPLGMGLGTVGPASVRFEKRLTENWFLQIAVELGWLGLIIWLAILVELSRKLLSQRKNIIQVGLFAALLGISVTGFFTHSFEETTTVLLFITFTSLTLTRSE